MAPKKPLEGGSPGTGNKGRGRPANTHHISLVQITRHYQPALVCNEPFVHLQTLILLAFLTLFCKSGPI
jgi:hypothetical protein